MRGIIHAFPILTMPLDPEPLRSFISPPRKQNPRPRKMNHGYTEETQPGTRRPNAPENPKGKRIPSAKRQKCRINHFLTKNPLLHHRPDNLGFHTLPRIIVAFVVGYQALEFKLLGIAHDGSDGPVWRAIWKRGLAVGFAGLGPGVDGVEVDEHVDEEDEEEGEAVEDENVGYVCYFGVRKELHLFFGCAHEQEA